MARYSQDIIVNILREREILAEIAAECITYLSYLENEV